MKTASLAYLATTFSPSGPSGGPIPLESGTDETMRCYFMRKGLLKEAKFYTGMGTRTVTTMID